MWQILQWYLTWDIFRKIDTKSNNPILLRSTTIYINYAIHIFLAHEIFTSLNTHTHTQLNHYYKTRSQFWLFFSLRKFQIFMSAFTSSQMHTPFINTTTEQSFIFRLLREFSRGIYTGVSLDEFCPIGQRVPIHDTTIYEGRDLVNLFSGTCLH